MLRGDVTPPPPPLCRDVVAPPCQSDGTELGQCRPNTDSEMWRRSKQMVEIEGPQRKGLRHLLVAIESLLRF